MGHRVFAVLVLVAIVCFAWAATVFGGYWDFGNPWFIEAIGFGFTAASLYHLCGHPYTAK